MLQLLRKLIKQGVRLNAANNELKIQLGSIPVSNEDKEALKLHKKSIIEYLHGSKVACLSFQQERLWFLDQLGYGFQYHVPGLGMIEGTLNAVALQQSIDFIIAIHESFRTNFKSIEGTPAKFVKPYVSLPIAYIDLSALNDAEKNHKKNTCVQAFIEQPFNLEEDVLFRICLIKLAENYHAMVMCMHHIITDGWSMKVLLQDIQYAYNCFCKGTAPDSAPLKLQYMGYSSWQKEALTDEKLTNELSYWKQQLAGYQDLDMPLDYTRPLNSTGKGNYIRFSVDKALGKKAKNSCKEKQISAFSLFTAAVYMLLNKYSRQNDICLGMPVANRSHTDLESIIGFFVNTVVIRINPAQTETLTGNDLLKLVNGVMVDAQDNQSLPIEKILEFLQPERNLGRTPIFQVLINYTPVSIDKIHLGDAVLTPSFDMESQTSKFELTFTYNDFEDGRAEVFIEYSTDLYSDNTIERMALQLQKLMAFLVNDADKKITQVDVLSDTERKTILNDWNETSVDYPTHKCIHELFEEQANKTPHQPAIIAGTTKLTYTELNKKSTTLAVYLKNQGVQSNTLVGLCIHRSVDMIVALLAIIKAGGAYVPLDSSYPKDRIGYMLNDSGIDLILTDDSTRTIIKDYLPDKNIRLLSISESSEAVFSTNEILQVKSSPENLAYVMYTSGSTGFPKGVMITHRNVVNHNLSVINAYKISPEDRVLQFSSISFDIFVEEVFPTLLSGAALVIMANQQFMDVNYVKETVASQGVSIMNLPTAYWNALAGENFSGTALRLVIIGGEKAELTYYQLWHTFNPTVEVMNTYGPTETTVISLLHKIEPEDIYGKTIPIGKPIGNTLAYVLDKNMQALPVGIPGELHIGGAGLAKGYFNKPLLTAERFVENPFKPGNKIYKTGDLVKWRSDGSLEYLGRTDEQVKIRGYRIEPREIEAVLLSCDGVKEAVIVAKPEQNGKQLVAFYTLKPNVNISAETIHSFLKGKLPDYMVPSYMKEMKAIPLTPNGKTDLKQLERETTQISSPKTYKEPQTESEKKIATIWQSLLGITRVSIYDNFFHLGGHSLKAIQVVREIEILFHKKVPLTVLFENPILHDLAFKIDSTAFEHTNTSDSSFEQKKSDVNKKENKQLGNHCLISLRETPGSAAYFIIPGMPGLVNGYLELAKSIPEGGQVYGLELPGCTAGEPLSSITEITTHHIELIKSVINNEEIHLIAHSFGGTILYEMLRQFDSSLQIGTILLVDSFRLNPYDFSQLKNREQFCIGFTKYLGFNETTVNNVLTAFQQSTEINWEENSVQQIASDLNVDKEIILRLWNTVKTSMSISYTYNQTLHQKAKLVVAKADITARINEEQWSQCFTDTEVIYSDADHFSIVKQPYCEIWLKEIFEKSSITN